MKAFLSVCLLAVFSIHGAWAQSVHGIVEDEKGKPLELITVSLLNAADSSWLRSEVTNAKGYYSIVGKEGSYLLLAAAVGFESQTKACKLIIGDTISNVNFQLLPKAGALEGVTVTSKAPFIEAKPGMMVVNVENSAASAGSNALELLQRSPGVQVDPQGAVSLKGRNGVQVYVDGRPSRLSGDQLTAYLRSMTAEEIAQIELITQPGAKYEAAGTAGIINIRTRSVKKQGLNGNLSMTGTKATEAMGNVSGRLTYRRNKLTLYASEYYNYVDQHNKLDVERRYFKEGTNELSADVLTRQEVRFTSRFHRMKAGGEYKISDKTTVGIRAQVPFGHPEVKYRNFSTLQDVAAGTTSYNLGRRDMDNRWHEKEVGLLGRHRFQDEGELTVDGYYVSNHGADRGLFINKGTDANGNPTTPADLWDIAFPVDLRVISAQTDYSRPMGKKTKLEAGFKYSNVDIDNQAIYLIPDNNGVFVSDTMRSTRFLYKETLAAVYGTLNRTINQKLETQLGLRAEQTIGDGRVTKTGEAFKRNYLSIFPTVFASYKADTLNTITFSYGRRLDRPNYYILNPARNYIDKYSYSVGNPQLMPEFVNNMELGYSYKGELTATLSYTRTNGVISDFFVQDDKTKTAYEIHDNIDGYDQCGISINYNKAIAPWWTTNVYGDFYYKAYSGNYYGIDYNQRGSTHSFNVNNQFMLKHKWGAELSGWYNGGGLATVFTRPKPMGSVNIAVSKKMLADSLVLRLAFNDVFGTQEYNASNRFANFDTDVHSTWDARRAVLSVNYNFGKNIELMQRKSEAERRM
jgi:iron complex outermembrane receptor protein